MNPKLGDFVDDRRRERRVTVAEEAKRIGIAQSKLSDIINYDKCSKESNLTECTIKALCDYYNISADYVLGYSDAPSRDESIQNVHKLTGLSPQSITNLLCIKTYESEFMKIINAILSSKYLIPFVNSVESYLQKEDSSDPKNILSNELVTTSTHIDRFDEIESEVWKKITLKAYVEEFMWKIIAECEEKENAKK